ncbi:MAG: hypothetical protein KAR21_11975 [Spirochaetales bacterium]|nr:hypothetical protein [Spirochaetales bacterium]
MNDKFKPPKNLKGIITVLNTPFTENDNMDISIHFFKRLLWKQGIYASPKVRKPILHFDHIHERED